MTTLFPVSAVRFSNKRNLSPLTVLVCSSAIFLRSASVVGLGGRVDSVYGMWYFFQVAVIMVPETLLDITEYFDTTYIRGRAAHESRRAVAP